jgi:hypothetical protein
VFVHASRMARNSFCVRVSKLPQAFVSLSPSGCLSACFQSVANERRHFECVRKPMNEICFVSVILTHDVLNKFEHLLNIAG